MPLAALFVVQATKAMGSPIRFICFNAARGFVCSASRDSSDQVHAPGGFNAARGFVCSASRFVVKVGEGFVGFNAARGFVCSARPSLAALVSLVSNGSFGKSPDV